MANGRFIVLEGSDGSGKTTQFNILREKLASQGYEIEVFDFPRYGQPSSHFVEKYLNGAYGPATSVSPYAASLFFAVDRFEAAPAMRRALEAGKIVLCNRYVGSNMAHQGAKFQTDAEKRGFFVWEDSLEFQLLGLPRPNKNLYLRVPAEMAQKLIGQKRSRSYTQSTHDEHEADLQFLKNSVTTYDLLCSLFSTDYQLIECTGPGGLLDINAVADKVWRAVEPLLPPVTSSRLAAQAPKPETRTPPKPQPPSNEPQASLESVMAFDRLSLLVASDMRSAGVRVRFTGPHSWAFPASHGYLVPEGLPADLEDKFRAALEIVKEAHQRLEWKLLNHFSRTENVSRKKAAAMARPVMDLVTPVSAIVPVELELTEALASEPAVRQALSRRPELRDVASRIMQPISAGGGNEVKSGAIGDLPESINVILSRLNNVKSSPLEDQAVKILEAAPRNEFAILAEVLFQHSDLPIEKILSEIEILPYHKKLSSLRQALRQQPGLLSLMSYRVEATSSRPELYYLAGPAHIKIQQHQPASPRYGYDVPEIVEKAGAEDDFLAIFDTMLELYSHFQIRVTEPILEYATLMGHRLRWQATLRGAEILSLKANSSIRNELVEALSELHPITADFLARRTSSKINRKKPLNKVTGRQ